MGEQTDKDTKGKYGEGQRTLKLLRRKRLPLVYLDASNDESGIGADTDECILLVLCRSVCSSEGCAYAGGCQNIAEMGLVEW